MCGVCFGCWFVFDFGLFWFESCCLLLFFTFLFSFSFFSPSSQAASRFGSFYTTCVISTEISLFSTSLLFSFLSGFFFFFFFFFFPSSSFFFFFFPCLRSLSFKMEMTVFCLMLLDFECCVFLFSLPFSSFLFLLSLYFLVTFFFFPYLPSPQKKKHFLFSLTPPQPSNTQISFSFFISFPELLVTSGKTTIAQYLCAIFLFNTVLGFILAYLHFKNTRDRVLLEALERKREAWFVLIFYYYYYLLCSVIGFLVFVGNSSG